MLIIICSIILIINIVLLVFMFRQSGASKKLLLSLFSDFIGNNKQEMKLNNADLDGKFSQKFSDLKIDLIEKYDEKNRKLEINIQNIDEKILRKLVQIEEKLNSKISEFSDKNFQQIKEIISEFTKFKDSIKNSYEQFDEKIIARFNNFDTKISSNLQENIQNLKESNTKNFEKLILKVDTQLDRISDKVNEKLESGFKKTNDTFIQITQRLVKIDEAQKKIEDLTTNVNSLQNILSDKKTRGVFGEVQLNNILKNILGEKNDSIFGIQFKIGDFIADAVIHLPEPHGMMAIDSKFPLESYNKMFDVNTTPQEKNDAKKQFKRDVRKHVDDIAEKYIQKGITSDVAVMFLPAEAVFAELYAYHNDVIDYAISKNIWICSPTTLIAVLTTIQSVIRDIETGKQAKIIQSELAKLSQEFTRYNERWTKLSKHIKTVNKDVDEINITSQKITKRFGEIRNVKIEEIAKE